MQRTEFADSSPSASSASCEQTFVMGHFKAADAGAHIDEELQHMRELVAHRLRVNHPLGTLVERGQAARPEYTERHHNSDGRQRPPDG